MTPELYPLICKPIFIEKLWGGRKLEDWFPNQLPADGPIGEAWCVADLREGSSLVSNGVHSGKTLSEVNELWGDNLRGFGWSEKDSRFPLLIKFIDANENLSVQVHPSDEDCEKKFPSEFGKDESWIMVGEQVSSVLFGFQPDQSLESFNNALENSSIESILRQLPVRKNDILRIAPGTVHAICEGAMVLEIQQPSDSTFRIYDYGRTDDAGIQRPLHLDESRAVMNYEYQTNPIISPEKTATEYGDHELLVDVPAYRIERALIEHQMQWIINPISVQVLIVLSGSGTLTVGKSEGIVSKEKFAKGDTIILPANIGKVMITPDEPVSLVCAGFGGNPMMPR